jgi:hypothetical protein
VSTRAIKILLKDYNDSAWINKKNMGLIIIEKKPSKPICVLCGEEHGLEYIHSITIKGKNRNICKECATAIKGLV